jgi:hypothetical protein
LSSVEGGVLELWRRESGYGVELRPVAGLDIFTSRNRFGPS